MENVAILNDIKTENKNVGLEDVKNIFKKWLYFKDENLVDVVLGSVIANRTPSDPIWLFIVAPAGGSKTEVIRSLDTKEIYQISSLSQHSLISGYAHLLKLKSVVCRLANVVGLRSRHGVIYDFYTKLERNPSQLRVLGDGTQSKSYLYVDDCVKALVTALENTTDYFEHYNVGTEDKVDVLTIARIVTEEMGLHDVKISCTGGVNGGRGWKGDVKNMLLDISKIKTLGWAPKYNSIESIRLAVKHYQNKIQ